MSLHAKKRLRQRYRVEHTGWFMAAICKRIKAGQAKLVRPLRDGCTLWRVYVAKQMVEVVWSERTTDVVTVLPPRRKRRRESAADAP